MIRLLWLLVLVGVAAPAAFGQDVASPPTDSKQFIRAAAPSTSSNLSLLQTPTNGTRPGPCKSLSVRNDGAAGTAAIHVAINAATVATPTDNAINAAHTVNAGEELKLNGTFTQVSYKAATGTQAVRITWSY